jgi:hypothetical protein
MKETHEIPVRFAGCQSRNGLLTQGQDNIIRVLLSGADQAALHAIVDISSDIDIARIADALAALMMRHESLRTTYRLGPPIRQQVASDGELMMPVHAVATDPRQFAVELRRRLWARFFDLEQELPLRAELVTGAGPLHHLVLVLSHAAVDVAALDIVLNDLTELLAGRPLPPPGRQPLDLVEMEGKPAMRSRLLASRRHWEEALRAGPQSLFGVPMPADRGYHHGVLIRSAPAAAAIESIAKRTKASRSAVALAAFAVLVSFRTRNSGIIITSTAANRFHPALHDYVGTLAMDAVLAVDLRSAETFEGAVGIASRSSLRALWHGSFDTPELWATINNVGHERGIQSYTRECVYNDMSPADGDVFTDDHELIGTPDESVDRIVRPGLGEFTVLRQDFWPSRLRLNVHWLHDDLVAAVWADPLCLTGDETVAFALGLVRLLTKAAVSDVPLSAIGSLTGLSPVPRGDGWYLIDASWIELSAVRQLVAEVVGARPFLVKVFGDRLVCYVADKEGTLTPEQLHRECVAALPGNFTAMAPHRYVICRRPPDDPSDPASWRLQPAHEGTGRLEPAEVAR